MILFYGSSCRTSKVGLQEAREEREIGREKEREIYTSEFALILKSPISSW
jgi:hypothetical protein